MSLCVNLKNERRSEELIDAIQKAAKDLGYHTIVETDIDHIELGSVHVIKKKSVSIVARRKLFGIIPYNAEVASVDDLVEGEDNSYFHLHDGSTSRFTEEGYTEFLELVSKYSKQ